MMTQQFWPISLTLALVLMLGACASKQNNSLSEGAAHTEFATVAPAVNPASAKPQAPQSVADASNFEGGATSLEYSLDDYEDEQESQVSDPFEGWNRFWFRFNDVMLLNVLKPVHQGYSYVVPTKIRSGLSNFAYNLASPVRFLNSLLQGKFGQAGVEFGRFFINSITSFGLADVAQQSKPRFEYHPQTANFGHTLAVWGLPEGAYLVWPFFGPNTARGTLGMVGDGFMRPQTYAMTTWQSVGERAAFTFNQLDKLYTPYEKAKEIAIDPYVFIRNAYITLQKQLSN